jgi:hypothetical protein
MSWRITACGKCLDCPTMDCKNCSCTVCGGKHDEESQIICDECDDVYHIACLDPPLDVIPEGDEEWYNKSSFIMRMNIKILFMYVKYINCLRQI